MTTLTLNTNNYITIEGKRFHYIWLRDNCQCPKCLHPESLEKLFDVIDKSKKISSKPLSATLDNDQLIINWDEEPPHQSVFSSKWLLNQAYDIESPNMRYDYEPYRKRQQLWDKAWLEENQPEWPDASADYETWFEQLSTLGMTILQNMAPADLEPFLTSIGPIYPAVNGPLIWSIKASPETQGDLAFSKEGFALTPHTDAAGAQDAPLIQFLYCQENQASGGQSMVVDGFKIADVLRREYPEQFKLLTETPISFHGFFEKYSLYYRRTSPIIMLNWAGDVAEICFNKARKAPFHVPFEQMEAYYEAYSLFYDLINDHAYQYRFRLKSGDCLLVQNFRLLHGREAFNPASGERHLKAGYISWEHFLGRGRYYAFKHLFV